MRVDWLSLHDYRSYDSLDWAPEPGVNLLIGPNGAGKTNLLEAVAYIASLRSFRSVPDRALVADDRESAVIRAGVVGEERERLVEIEVPRTGQRRTQVDKTRLRRSADLLGVVRVITFLPEDLDLVKRGPSYRRDLLDDVAVQLWPAAYLDRTEFERSLRQRNAFLKVGERDDTTLSVWDSRLAQTGGRLLARRARVVDILKPLLSAAYGEIAGSAEAATFAYEPSWGEGLGTLGADDYASLLSEALGTARAHDYDRRMTSVGPHRDEPGFDIEGHDARVHGSQGEQRTMALAVKLAAHRAVADVIGEEPVLLLDDVFSELDPERSAALAGALPPSTQTMISSARPEDVPVDGKTWQVGSGVVT